ncbi:MAG TPA: DUF2064 domain-containing protein [Myxococcota bacterium]|nr:DUF2064 domain-containing protein [Myxococcota bacterium]
MIAVAVISKLPRLGHSKTRLARVLGQEAALALHRAFLRDELEQLRAPGRWRLHLVHDAGSMEYAGVQGLVPGASGLAEELLAAFQILLREHERVVIVSGDVPQLTQDRVAEALAALDDNDLVLGPGPDGGYYLVGLKAPHDVFTPIEMGRSTVVAATCALARELELTTALMSSLVDIDEAQDLLALEGLSDGVARHTREVVRDLGRGVIAPRLPTELQIELTSRCNLACSACLRSHEELAPDADLDLAGVLAIIDPLPDLQRLSLQLNGESMLAPGLFDVLSEASSRGITTVLNTNGTLLTAERRARLLSCGLDELRVSLDGARASTVARMAGADILERVVEGVSALMRERPEGHRLAVSLWMVANRWNIDELPELVELAALMGVSEVYLQRLVLNGHGVAVEENSLHGRAGEIEPVFTRARALAEELGIALRASGRRPLEESLTPEAGDRPQLGCYRPWRSAVVTASRKVLPCCISSFTAPYSELERGDLERQGWSEIWNAEPYQALRAGILSGEPLEFCAGCGVDWSL